MNRILTLLVLFVLISSCENKSKKITYNRFDYPDVLDIKNIPSEPVDWSSFCFFDLGSWYGFALPPDTLPGYYGSFPGPFLAIERKWMGEYIAKLNVADEAMGRIYNLSEAENKEVHYFPGLLSQKFNVRGLQVELNLFYSDANNTVISARLKNTSDEQKKIHIEWTGQVFKSAFKIREKDGGVAISSISDTTNMFVYSGKKEAVSVVTGGDSYKMLLPAVELKSGESFSSNLFVAFHSPGKTINVDNAFRLNEIRWNNYLGKVLAGKNSWNYQRSYQNIAVKATETLVSNWKSKYGGLHHDGLFPSYAVADFNGFWAWDSWKHAVALAIFAPELAKNQIRAMYDYQNDDGMVADCIYADSTENNWLNTKPPLSGWAIWEVFLRTGDKSFLEEMFPKLVKYHEWWYRKRDFNHNLLCEYGSSDQSLVAAKWESGMDNAVRFDSSTMIKIDDDNWAFNQESVDLNSYLYNEKLYISMMFKELGNHAESVKWIRQAEKIKGLINSKMYDKKSGFYYDINAGTGEFVKVMGPEGWAPLYNKVATPEIAKRVIKVMLNKQIFYTFIPFPTVSVAEKEFSTGYWRGPIWIDQTYFAIMGLYNYGYKKEAREATLQLFDNLEGLKGQAPIRENYWPLDGRGMRVNHFSWSAAHLLLLYQTDFN